MRFPLNYQSGIWLSGIWLLAALATFQAGAASRLEIDARVQDALETLYQESAAARQLADKALGILVFPDVIKAGLGLGGEYGEGALLVNGKSRGYYNVVSASIGFQFGAQVKSQVLMFMTRDALDSFTASQGWEAGVDGSVAIAEFGVGTTLDTHTARQPIIAFIFSNKGLMYNLTLEGSKFSRIFR